MAKLRKDWKMLVQPTQMISRARRKSLDYKDMVKTIENISEKDEEDPIIKLALLDRKDIMVKEKKGKLYIKKKIGK
jgi:hypothetical protein